MSFFKLADWNNCCNALHSIAIINSKVPGVNWITLTAKEPASELGIRLKQTDDGMIMTLTENQKLVNIIRITEAKKKITMTTSTGGSCEISQEIQKFTVRDKNKNFTDIDMNVIGRGTSPPAFVGILEEETVSIPVLAEEAEAPAWFTWIATVAPFL